jgi:hypothetical protein
MQKGSDIIKPSEQSSSRWRRLKPTPLTYVAWVLAGWCATLGWIGLHTHVTSNDAAGNGMATGFVHGFAEAGLQLTVVVLALYLLIRWKPARYACVALLLLLSCAMLILVR